MRANAAYIRLAAGAVVLSAVTAAETALAQNPTDASQGRVTITLLVYNYAAIEDSTIIEAEREASRAFERAGVTLEWHNCEFGAGHVVSYAPCLSPWESSAIVVRVVRSIESAPQMTDDATLGFAIGRTATVCYGKARELSGTWFLKDGCVLGDAIAHELGHLLMPGHGHAKAGIMRAGWTWHDLSLMRKHRLDFLPAETVLIRANAARLGGEEALVSIAVER